MKIYTFILSACLLLLCPACYGVSRYLLLGGSGWDKIAIVNKNSKKIEWEHPLEKGWECNSVAVTPDGNILFSYSKGAKLITRDHKEIWNIAAPEGCEMQTARVLPNGNYLVPLFASSEIREISPSGQFVKSVKVDGNPFCVAALDNGNYLVACGDAHCFVELNFETEKVVRKVNASDIEGGRLFFVAQLLPIHGGSLYICNWQGHDGEAAKGHYPQLIEINEVGKIVWELNDNATFGMISSICPID